MAEEKKLYVIPQAIVDDLSRMVPYVGGEEFTDPREYLLNYFKLYSPATYYNDGTIQCSSGRNRSFLDLYFLTKAQFPEITLQEFAKLFFSLDQEIYGSTSEHEYHMFIYFCTNIRKPVIYTNKATFRYYFIQDKDWLKTYLSYPSNDILLSQIFDLAELDYHHFVKKD